MESQKNSPTIRGLPLYISGNIDIALPSKAVRLEGTAGHDLEILEFEEGFAQSFNSVHYAGVRVCSGETLERWLRDLLWQQTKANDFGIWG